MLTFQKERFSDIAPDLPPLFLRHFEEVAHDKDRISLAPDWEGYSMLEAAGRLHIITARDDGKLVGYFFADIGYGLHNHTSLISGTDMFYLDPEYRKGLNGYRLLKTAIEGLEFDKMKIQTKIDRNLGRIFERLGFRAAEIVYTRVK